MNIEWKKNAVCYANGRQWYDFEGTKGLDLVDVYLYSGDINDIINADDFQLNIPREGDYLRKEDLDCEGKYNDTVEVFELFGIVDPSDGTFWDVYDVTFIDSEKLVDRGFYLHHHNLCRRELTYNQVMTIGKIKRLLDEQESGKGDTICGQPKGDYVKAIERVAEQKSESRNTKRNKAKQAYDILQSLDYGYDLVEQRWYRKDWV